MWEGVFPPYPIGVWKSGVRSLDGSGAISSAQNGVGALW